MNRSLEYGLYPTEADITALWEFSSASLRRLFAAERYHQKLAKIWDAQFVDEKQLTKDKNGTTEVLSIICQESKCDVADSIKIYTRSDHWKTKRGK